MQEYYAEIQEASTEVIAISSESVNMTKRIIHDNGLKYAVLCDNKLQVIADYNVMDPNNSRIARPATYILNADGRVAWITLDPEKTRVPTTTLLAELSSMDRF